MPRQRKPRQQQEKSSSAVWLEQNGYVRLEVPMTKAERQAIQVAAAKQGYRGMSSWARSVLMEAAAKVP